MKKLCTTVITLLVITLPLWSQTVPQYFHYQALISNEGEIVTNQDVALKISILSGSDTGEEVYSETHDVTTNASGVVSLNVGAGSNVSGSFDEIDWSTGNFYLKISLDASGGENYTDMGASQLVSVPYSLYSGGLSSSKAYISNTTDDTYISRFWNSAGELKYELLDGGYSVYYPITDSFDETGAHLILKAVNSLGYQDYSMDIYKDHLRFYTYMPSGTAHYEFSNYDNTTVNNAEVTIGSSGQSNLYINEGTEEDQYTLTMTKTGSSERIINIGTAGNYTFKSSSTDAHGLLFSTQLLDGSEWTNSGGYISFSPKNVEAMRLTQDGNVGIGTTEANSKLTVSGDIQVTDSANGVILKSPNGSCYKITVDNNGNLTTTSVSCP